MKVLLYIFLLLVVVSALVLLAIWGLSELTARLLWPPTPIPVMFPSSITLTGEGRRLDSIRLDEGTWKLQATVTDNCAVGRCPDEPSEFSVYLVSVNGGGDMYAVNETVLDWSGFVRVPVGEGSSLTPGQQRLIVDAAGEWIVTLLRGGIAQGSDKSKIGK